MKIVLNGAATEVRASQLVAVLDELGYGGATIATAVNERFVAGPDREATIMAEGDRLEVVAPRQGG